MKNLIYFVCLAFAGIFLLGCEKNDMPEPEKPREEEPADSTDIVDPEEPILLLSRRTILKMELSWICRVLRLKVGYIAIG